jgi:hypothetical protein
MRTLKYILAEIAEVLAALYGILGLMGLAGTARDLAAREPVPFLLALLLWVSLRILVIENKRARLQRNYDERRAARSPKTPRTPGGGGGT